MAISELVLKKKIKESFLICELTKEKSCQSRSKDLGGNESEGWEHGSMYQANNCWSRGCQDSKIGFANERSTGNYVNLRYIGCPKYPTECPKVTQTPLLLNSSQGVQDSLQGVQSHPDNPPAEQTTGCPRQPKKCAKSPRHPSK